MPFLRAFTNNLSDFVVQHQVTGWDCKLHIPQEVKEQVISFKHLLENWSGRDFIQDIKSKNIHSDSSHFACGGIDLQKGNCVQDFWGQNKNWHINVKEINAAAHTIKSLAKPGQQINLSVDNTVAYSYLRKWGGKLEHFNSVVRDLWHWCHQNNVFLNISLVKSEVCMADQLSRTIQKEDMSLNQALFSKLLHRFSTWVQPTIDMFASPGNSKLESFCARHPHWNASLIDALTCPLETVQDCYANPPWTIIQQWLLRLKQNPQVKCLMILPYWVSARWWPLVIRLKVPKSPVVLIKPFQVMFVDPMGTAMPPPR